MLIFVVFSYAALGYCLATLLTCCSPCMHVTHSSRCARRVHVFRCTWFVYHTMQTASGGTNVRKTVEPLSEILRTEPKDAVLLLLSPQAPCGSFFVYGGWVGGPGRESDVRLVSRVAWGSKQFTPSPHFYLFFYTPFNRSDPRS